MEALRVAEYVVTYCYKTGSPVTNLQLQKMLYFLWIDYYKKYNEPLFTDRRFEAWPLGPVIRDVYYRFCSFGSMTILPSIARIENADLDLPNSKRNSIDSIIKKYANRYVSTLVNDSHEKGHAWDRVYQEGKGNKREISYDSIIRLECGNK